MSVLLEALKKAAEDKKKALEGSTEAKSDLSPKVEAMPQKKVLEEERDKERSGISIQEKNDMKIELSLDSTPLVDKTDNLDVSDNQTVPTSESPVQETEQATLSLKLDNVSSIKPSIKKEPLKTASDSDGSKKAIDSIANTLKLVVEDSDSIKSTSNDDTSQHQQKMAHTEETKQEEPKLNLSLSEPVLPENGQEKTAQTLQAESELNDPPLIKVEEEPIEVSPSVLIDEGALKESPLISEKELVKEDLDAVEPNPTSKLDKNKLKEDEESYKWSLDALPGYLGFGKKQRNKNKKASEKTLNPILVSGALSEEPPKERSFKLALILLVFLLVIGIFFYGVFYYQAQYEELEQRMKQYNLVKTPMVIKKVTELDEKNSQVLTESNTRTQDKASSQNPFDSNKVEESTVFEVEPRLEKNLVAEEPPENKETLSQQASMKNVTVVPNAQRTLEKPIMVEKTTKDKAKNVDVSHASNARDSSDLNRIQNTKKAVVVVHSEEDVLFEAYSSYEKGDLVQAKIDFERVLSMNPQNEFALIGLGNILVSKQQYFDAMAYYQQALSAQPSSLNAFEAIANISGHVDLNHEWKKALLNMLQDYPTSATLQYALGNLYATEQDWLAAQEVYFQAVSLEPNNPDYLVNLAVSLDQLGKYKSAARYYTEALAFVDVQPVNFNEVQVKNRLIAIRQFMAGRDQ